MIELGTYPGGKGVVFRNIINEMPPHKTYVEAFVGGGSVALNKLPAERNILIDLDAEVIAAWLDHLAKNGGASAAPDSTMGAAIATCGDASGHLVTFADGTRWELYRADALRLLPLLRLGKDALVYADPPYLFDVRLSDRYMYRHELGLPEQHTALIGNLDQLGCKVMISGYWSSLYAGLLVDGWRSYSFRSRDRGGNIREEYVWCNFPEPARLHDYRFLGGNFRERERIKRKAARWVGRFDSLPALERRAILEQLESAGVLD